MPSKSPAQARLMRAVAHGWKPDRMKGPSRAVAREFVEADKKYSGGFAENRYWTGGLAAMNEINSGVPQTLNFQEGGSVWGTEPRVMDMKNFRDIFAIAPMEAEGWQWDEASSTMYPPLWNIDAGGYEQTINQPETTTSLGSNVAPTTGIGTPYVGSWGSWGSYVPPTTEPEPAPVRDIPGAGPTSGSFSDPIAASTGIIPRIMQTVYGGGAQSQWTPEQIAAWEQEQRDASRQSSYRDQLREHKASVAATLNPVAQQLGTGYSTGGRADMETVNLRRGGRGRALRTLGGGGRRAGAGAGAGGGAGPSPEELHRWYSLNPGKPYPGAGTRLGTAAAMTGAAPAPLRANMAGITALAQQNAPQAAPASSPMLAMPIGGAIPADKPFDMSPYKTGGISGLFTKVMKQHLEKEGWYEGADQMWYPAQSTLTDPGSGGATRNLPGASTSPTSPPAISGGPPSGWTPGYGIGARESGYREQLRTSQARAADLLNPKASPGTGIQPPQYGDAPEPGMAYAGGVPGWYSPGGPGYGGQLSGGGYGYEGDPSKPGYDDSSYEEFAAQQRITAPDITDEVLRARYEGRNANQGVIYTSGIGGARGGYMNYQEGGAVAPRRKPDVGGGPAIPGHPEGTNPHPPNTAMYRMWERLYHYAPPPPPPPPEPEEEPGWWESLFGVPEIEELKNRTERGMEEAGVPLEARGGYMRGYRGGGHVRGYQGGGLAQAQETQQAGFRQPPAGGVPPRWTPQQQASWRGAAGNPAARSAMSQQYRQRQALQNRAPAAGGRLAQMQADQQRQAAALSQQGAGQAGMMADAQAQQQALAAQRGAAGGARDFMFQGQPPASVSAYGQASQGMPQYMADYQQGLQSRANQMRPAVMPGGGQMIGGGQGVLPGEGDLGNYRRSIYDRPFGNLRDQMSRQGTPPTPGGPGRWTPQQRTQWGGAGAAERGAMSQQYRQGQALRNRPGGGGGMIGGARVPPNMRGFLQKQRMMNRPPSNVGGGVNRVGQQDQQGALSRAMQRGTGRAPMSRRSAFPGRR